MAPLFQFRKMKIPHSPRTVGIKFNMTPLIDVVFLLIIFFLVASHFVIHEPSEPVELPTAIRIDDKEAASPYQITITVTKDGRYQIAGDDQTLEMVEVQIEAARTEAESANKLSKFEVVIRGDKKTEFITSREILKICARSRVPVVSFAVLPK